MSRAAASEAASLGSAQERVSHMGPDGHTDFAATEPSVAYNPATNEFLVVWSGDDDTSPLVNDEFEIFGQRIAGLTGTSVGPRFRISDMGPDGDTAYGAWSPAVVYNPTSNEYLVVWQGEDNVAPLADGQREIFGQRLDGETASEVGANDFRVNRTVYEGAWHRPPSIAWNSNENEYLVAWEAFVGGEFFFTQIFVQRLSAAGLPLLADDRIVSHVSHPPGQGGEEAHTPVVAFNSVDDRYLVAWYGFQSWNSRLVTELFAQVVSPEGEPFAAADTRISFPGTSTYGRGGAMIPAIVYNYSANEFFVAWSAGDKMSPDPRSGAWHYLYGQRLTGTGALIGTQAIAFAKIEAVGAYWDLGALAFDDVANEYLVAWAARPWDVEIVTQRIGADGTLLGNVQVSRMGPEGDQRFRATSPAVAFNTSTGAALVTWQGDDHTAPLVDDEIEIFARVVTRPTPFVVGLGAFAGEGGWLAKRADAPGFAGVGWAQVPWPDYNLSGGGTYPAMGDIDGDSQDELILGLNPSGHRWLVILDDAAAQHRTLRWIQLPWPAFDTALHPASGDIDGDGVDEIVIGLGPGTAGWFAVLDDVLSQTPTLTWRQVEWPLYTSADGRTHPAVGDVDGDGAEEIIIGLGPGSNGWLEIFGGAASFAHREWLWVPWPEYTAANGTTWPAAGDVDADGRDELIAGLGTGGDGWFGVFDHSVTGFELRRWLQVTWPAYNDAVGETHPAVGNLDLDPGAEIAIGLGRYGSEGGWFQVFDNFLTYPGLETLTWGRVGWQAFEADGGATFPAIGPRR